MSEYFCHIHSDLDEAGLDVDAFRLYCHIARRGECWANVGTIAKTCGIGHKRVRFYIKHLHALGMIQVERRSGDTNVLRLAPRSAWCFDPNPCPNRVGVETDRGSNQTGDPLPNQADHPCPKRTDKVYPMKCIQEVSPKETDLDALLSGKSDAFKASWREWMAYRNTLLPKLAPGQFARQLENVAAWPESEVIAAVGQSIANGWKSLVKGKRTPTAQAPINLPDLTLPRATASVLQEL